MECWKELIPNLPCDITQFECWKYMTANKFNEGVDKLSEKGS